MRILHTSDWHIGKRLKYYSRLSEQREVLNEIVDIADREDVDAVVIAGDIFDTYNPPVEATELFYRTIKTLAKDGARAVIVIAGNHDSPDRIEVSDPLARECGIILAGYPDSVVPPFCLMSGLQVINSSKGFLEIRLPGKEYPLRVIHTSYANELRLKTYFGCEDPEQKLSDTLSGGWQTLADKYCDSKGVNIIAAHLFMAKKDGEMPEESDEERTVRLGGADALYSDILPDNIQYAALGHIHKHWVIDSEKCPVVYSGSPLCYGMSESGQTKYVMIIDAEPGEKAFVKKIELTKGMKIQRKQFNDIDQAVDWLLTNQDSLVELTISTDTYLSATDQKKLRQAHNGIIGIIPIINSLNGNGTNIEFDDDSNKSLDKLFVEYFRSRNNGLEPNNDLLELFREVTGSGEEL